jgi:hypothetical protein
VDPGRDHPKNVRHLQEVVPRAQNTIIILSSTINISGGTYVIIQTSTGIFTLNMNMIFIWALQIDEESGHGLDLDSLTPSRTNHVFHIL